MSVEVIDKAIDFVDRNLAEAVRKIPKGGSGTAPPKAVEDDEQESGGRRSMDAELRAMAALLRAVDGLDAETKCRVANWFAARMNSETSEQPY
jgi:hypothetical protein